MKLIATGALIAAIAIAPLLFADSIRVEHGYISVSIERGDQRYMIGMEPFISSSEAAGFLTYLDRNWPTESRPTIVFEDRHKAVQAGDEELEAALVRIEGSARWKVIRMPPARGAIPDSWSTLSALKKKWVEQAGVAQPDSQPIPLRQPAGLHVDSDHVAQELEELETLAFHRHQTSAALEKLRTMWLERDPLRRPAIAYLMCQLGDRSVVPDVATAFFGGEYDTGRSIEPDGSAAGANATVDSLRTLILYGSPRDHLQLAQFLSVPRDRDPLFKAGELCGVLLDLSSNIEGRGLPPGYPANEFPLCLAIRCLDYAEEVRTVTNTADNRSVSLRGCDLAAQTIQNVKRNYFGHDKGGSLEERDRSIEKIKKWWKISNSPAKKD